MTSRTPDSERGRKLNSEGSEAMSSVQAVVVASGEARVVRGSYRSLSARGRGPRDTAGLSAEQCCMTSLRTVFLVQQSSSSRRGIRPTGGRVRYGPTKGKYYTVLLRGCALIVSKIVEASRSGANRGQDQDSRASGRREGPSPVSFTSDTFSRRKRPAESGQRACGDSESRRACSGGRAGHVPVTSA